MTAMAEEQPVAPPEDEQPVYRSFTSTLVQSVEIGAAVSTGNYALAKGEEIVSKIKDAVSSKKE
jgi:hypothetical protein